MAEELCFVAEHWHIAPNEWINTKKQVRSAMLKVERLKATAMRYARNDSTWTAQYFLKDGLFDQDAYDHMFKAEDKYAHLDLAFDDAISQDMNQPPESGPEFIDMDEE